MPLAFVFPHAFPDGLVLVGTNLTNGRRPVYHMAEPDAQIGDTEATRAEADAKDVAPTEDAAEEAATAADAAAVAPADEDAAAADDAAAAAVEEAAAATKVQASIRGSQSRAKTWKASTDGAEAAVASADELAAARVVVYLGVGPRGTVATTLTTSRAPGPTPSPRAPPPNAGGSRQPPGGASRRSKPRERGASTTLPILDRSRRNLTSADGLGDEMSTLSPRTVWLHDNHLDAASGAPLGALLCAAPKRIVRLNLSGNNLCDEGAGALLAALDEPSAAALASLGLGLNMLTDASASLLARAMTSEGAAREAGVLPLTGLKELRLGGNPIEEGGATALAAALAAGGAATGGAALETLHLGHTMIGDGGGEAIAKAILGEHGDVAAEAVAASSALRVLHMADSGLGLQSGLAYGRALSSPRCVLAELWLGGNPLTAEGAEAVASGLAHASALERLWLDSTGMDDTAAPHLAAALVSTSGAPLSQLWLGGNSLTDDAAGVLARALVESSPMARLRKLWLDRSDALTLEGAAVIVQAAEQQRSAAAAAAAQSAADDAGALAKGGEGDALQQIWIGGRGLGAEEKQALEALAVPHESEGLDGGGADVGGAAAAAAGGAGRLRLRVDLPVEGMDLSPGGRMLIDEDDDDGWQEPVWREAEAGAEAEAEAEVADAVVEPHASEEQMESEEAVGDAGDSPRAAGEDAGQGGEDAAEEASQQPDGEQPVGESESAEAVAPAAEEPGIANPAEGDAEGEPVQDPSQDVDPAGAAPVTTGL